jgi:uncharacterized protein (TIGR02246 family)
MNYSILTFALLLSFSFMVSLAKADTTEEQKLIVAEVAKYVAAFNQGDAKALAGLWTEAGVYINPRSGEQFTGREAIEKQFAQIFMDMKNARLEVQSESIQLVSPSVAVERGSASVTSAEQPLESSRYVAVYVKVNGAWSLDRITEEDVVEVPSNYKHLQELDWMVGQWTDESDTDRIEMNCQWSKNRNFMVRTFSVVSGDEIDFSGLQVIGWDPVGKHIRSWVFDSDGGYGDGVWRRHLQSWYVHTTGILPDGAKATGVSVMNLVDDNNFTFKTIDRQVDGELLPNLPESLVVRQKSAE